MAVRPETLSQLRVPGTSADVDPDDGWGVALVERKNAMINGGVTVLEVHWYPNVAERRYGPDRYNRFGSIFVTADGIYVRDSALNMAHVPLTRWRQMNIAQGALRSLAGLGAAPTAAVDWSTTVTHQWVRRPEDGGARLIRDHLDLIEPPEVKATMDKLRAAAAADLNSAENVAARARAIAESEGR